MHMRPKAWARPELAACPYYVPMAAQWRGRWREHFSDPNAPFHIELGCGKGVSTAHMVFDNPDVHYLAVDMVSSVLGEARRNLARAFGDAPITNVHLAVYDVAYIEQAFAPEDRVSRIYIYFPNPWSAHRKHFKRRLTHPRQLWQYRQFLTDDGEIWFKTDDVCLWKDTHEYLREAGFRIRYETDDLAASGFTPNYESEHQRKFEASGIPTHFLIAVK